MSRLRVQWVTLISVAAVLVAASAGSCQKHPEAEGVEWPGVKLFSIGYGSEPEQVGRASETRREPALSMWTTFAHTRPMGVGTSISWPTHL